MRSLCVKYTLQKRLSIFPSPAGMSLTKLFPARESLVSDIPAGDGKIINLFYSVAGTRAGIGRMVMGTVRRRLEQYVERNNG
jgi:hypothetical protein